MNQLYCSRVFLQCFLKFSIHLSWIGSHVQQRNNNFSALFPNFLLDFIPEVICILDLSMLLIDNFAPLPRIKRLTNLLPILSVFVHVLKNEGHKLEERIGAKQDLVILLLFFLYFLKLPRNEFILHNVLLSHWYY